MMRPSIFSRAPKRRADDDDLNMSMAKRTKVDVIGNFIEVNVSLPRSSIFPSVNSSVICT